MIDRGVKDGSLPEGFEEQVMRRMEEVKPVSRWMKVAAVFVGVLLVSGIALAAWQLSDRADENTSFGDVQTATTLQPVEAQGDIVRFDNVQLDSVLTIVARHYGKQVVCRNETVRNLHFHIDWNQAAPLSDFITLINNFEGVTLREEQDTIIAE